MTLKEFLVKEGVWKQFCKNVRESDSCTVTQYRNDARFNIGDAFGWHRSPEGTMFWDRLYTKSGDLFITMDECKPRVKATKLAKRLYPDRVEKDGYLEI